MPSSALTSAPVTGSTYEGRQGTVGAACALDRVAIPIFNGEVARIPGGGESRQAWRMGWHAGWREKARSSASDALMVWQGGARRKRAPAPMAGALALGRLASGIAAVAARRAGLLAP
jgi:hypothetical protein